MSTNYFEIQELLQQKAEQQARLNLLPYNGNPEIKEQKGSRYLYIRKRVAGRLTSTYVDVYSDELYQMLRRNATEARELNKAIRKVNKKLTALGYEDAELPTRVLQNLDFARANMKANIYDQAVLEGVATSFPQTEEIIDNGKVNGVSATDVQKILNLRHAWEFILDKDVIQSETNYYILCHIAKLVNEGFFLMEDVSEGFLLQLEDALMCRQSRQSQWLYLMEWNLLSFRKKMSQGLNTFGCFL